MKTFHGVTLMAARCSSALCFLLLPAYLIDQQRGQLANGKHPNYLQLASTAHPQPPNNLYRPSSVSFTSPSKLNLPLPSTSTALLQSTSELSESNDDDSSKENKSQKESLVRRLKQSAQEKLQAILQNGRSWLNGVRAGERTEMEAAVLQDPLPIVLPKSNKLRIARTRTSSNVTLADDDDEIVQESSVVDDTNLPKGPRWAIAHPSTNLSGTWKPIITPEFQRDYDQYLTHCGTNFYFRKVCLNFCSTTRETIVQQDDGRVLQLTGSSPAGGWKRSLLSSGADTVQEDYEAVHAKFLDPDRELVKVEAWWEDQGKVHTSFLREKPGVCGGEFESRRYLATAEDGTVELVCESTFHPAQKDIESQNSKFKPAFVRWRYRQA